MTKKKATAEVAPDGTDDGAKGGKVKKIGIGVVVAAVLFLAGGKVMGGASPAVAALPTTTTIAVGPVVTLDAITLNLADGHLLKVGVAFQLSHEAGEARAVAGGEGAAPAVDSSDPTKGYARALDIVIQELGSHTEEQLSGDARAVAKHQLVARLTKEYHGTIEDVYFHQFVMQ